VRAAFAPAAGRLDLRDVAAPAPGPGEVLVRVRACGICGSDLHWYAGAGAPPRVCPGHEIAGAVAALGAGVRGVRVDDAVAVEPAVVCGVCVACRAGLRQRCPRLRILGMHRPGGLADFVLAPADALFALPGGLDWALAALTEPLAVCVHAVRRAAIEPGQRVLILGAGAIGLLSVAAARAAGATEVWITARYLHQAALAQRLGATRVFAADADGDAERAALTAERPIDAVLETVGGAADTIADGVRAVRAGGTVVVLGVFSGAPTLPATTLLIKEVRLVGSMMYDRAGPQADFAAAIELLAAQADALSPLVTHRLGLDDVAQAFAAAADKGAGAVKVSVLP